MNSIHKCLSEVGIKKIEHICLVARFKSSRTPRISEIRSESAINSVCAFTRKTQTVGINRQRRVPSFKSHPRGLILPSLPSHGQRNIARRRGETAQGESAILLIVDQIDPRRKSFGIDPGTRRRASERECSASPRSVRYRYPYGIIRLVSYRCRDSFQGCGSRKIRARDRALIWCKGIFFRDPSVCPSICEISSITFATRLLIPCSDRIVSLRSILLLPPFFELLWG